MLEALQAAKELVVLVAAAVTAIVAMLGLKAWGRELRGRAEYEVARQVVRGLYGVLRAIQDVRHPFIHTSEFEEAAEKRGQTYESRSLDSRYERFVYEERWNELQDAMVRLDGELAEAQVLWGWDFKDRVKPLRACVTKLGFSLNQYLRNRDKQLTKNSDIEKSNEADKIIYAISGDPEKDTFLAEVRAAIAGVESELRPHMLRSRGE